MSNSIPESLDQVNADLLPPQARKLVRLIGMVNTLKLLEQRGGTTLRIPVNAQDSTVLQAILPMEAVIALTEAMPGQRLELPKCDKILLQIRNLALRNERKHLSAAGVALKYDLSRRQVINICKTAVDNRQVDLLEVLNMADEADKTEALTEIALQSSLYTSRRDEPQAVAIGECLFCGEAVEQGRRWCDAQCRDDWQTENGQ